MSAIDELRARRERLIARSDLLRDEIAREAGAMKGSMIHVDRVVRVARFLGLRAPRLAIGLGLATGIMGPARVVSLLQGAQGIWRTFQGIRGLASTRRS
jgi:hypothetical protein